MIPELASGEAVSTVHTDPLSKWFRNIDSVNKMPKEYQAIKSDLMNPLDAILLLIL